MPGILGTDYVLNIMVLTYLENVKMYKKIVRPC